MPSQRSYPFIGQTSESSSSPHEAKRTMRGSFHPAPPQRNSTLQPSVVKWCCPHRHRSVWKKKTNNKKKKKHRKGRMIALTTSVSISQRWWHLSADGWLLYCWLSFTGDQLELDLDLWTLNQGPKRPRISTQETYLVNAVLSVAHRANGGTLVKTW